MREKEKALEHDELLALLDYDPETGVFRHKRHIPPLAEIGSVAGCIRDNRYRQINVNGRLYRAHRLAWFYMHRQWPPHDIDHINGNRDDNRIVNLRLATRSENLRNSGMRKDNTSGLKGVSWHAGAKKWVAQIKVEKTEKSRYLGLFKTKEGAHAAYRAASAQYHGDFGRTD